MVYDAFRTTTRWRDRETGRQMDLYHGPSNYTGGHIEKVSKRMAHYDCRRLPPEHEAEEGQDGARLEVSLTFTSGPAFSWYDFGGNTPDFWKRWMERFLCLTADGEGGGWGKAWVWGLSLSHE